MPQSIKWLLDLVPGDRVAVRLPGTKFTPLAQVTKRTDRGHIIVEYLDTAPHGAPSRFIHGNAFGAKLIPPTPDDLKRFEYENALETVYVFFRDPAKVRGLSRDQLTAIAGIIQCGN